MPYQVSRSAQSRRAIKTISKRVGIWNEDDDDVEEKEGDGLPASVPASACQRWRAGRR